MKISVVIPSHLRTQPCLQLVESLLRQNYQEDFEILVVANPPNQKLKSILDAVKTQSHQKLRYLETEAVGVNIARNLGLRQALGELVLFMDDDCEVIDPKYLCRLVDRFAQFPEATGIGGPYLYQTNLRLWEKAYANIAQEWLLHARWCGARTQQLIGGNACYRRSLLLQGFLFDENLRFGGTESELNHRLVVSGHRLLFFEDLAIFHHLKISLGSFFRKAFLQGRGFEFRKKTTPKTAAFVSLETSPTIKSIFASAYYYLFRKGQIYFRVNHVHTGTGTGIGFSAQFFMLWVLQDVRGFLRRPLGKPLRVPTEEFYGRKRLYDPQLGLNLKRDSTDPNLYAAEIFDHHLERAKFYLFDGIFLPVQYADLIRRTRLVGLEFYATLDLAHWREAWMRLLKTQRPSAIRVFLTPDSDHNSVCLEQLKKLDIPFWVAWPVAQLSSMTVPEDRHVELRFSYELPSYQLHRFLKTHSGIPRLTPPMAAPLMDSALQEGRDLYPLGEVVFSSLSGAVAPKISVIIPSYKSEWELNVVLSHLLQQDLPSDQFEILIVNDGSPDRILHDHVRWIRRQPGHRQIRLIHMTRKLDRGGMDQQYRAGIARNLGAAFAKGRFLSFLDADIVVPQNYLSLLLKEMDHSDVVQTRRLMLKAEASTPQTDVTRLRRYKDIYPEEPYWEEFKNANQWMSIFNFWKYTCTYSLTLRKSLFLSAGWFLPVFPNYGFEDTDLGYRLAKMGATFHLSELEVFHLYPRRQEFNFHLDLERRTEALAHSARIFYSHHLDERIFREFRWLLVTRDNLAWKAQRLYWKAFRFKGEAHISAVKMLWKAKHIRNVAPTKIYWQAHTVRSFFLSHLNVAYWQIRQTIGDIRTQSVHLYWKSRHRFWALRHWLWWNCIDRFRSRIAFKSTHLYWSWKPRLILFFGKPYFFLSYQYRNRLRPALRKLKSTP